MLILSGETQLEPTQKGSQNPAHVVFLSFPLQLLHVRCGSNILRPWLRGVLALTRTHLTGENLIWIAFLTLANTGLTLRVANGHRRPLSLRLNKQVESRKAGFAVDYTLYPALFVPRSIPKQQRGLFLGLCQNELDPCVDGV